MIRIKKWTKKEIERKFRFPNYGRHGHLSTQGHAKYAREGSENNAEHPSYKISMVPWQIIARGISSSSKDEPEANR